MPKAIQDFFNALGSAVTHSFSDSPAYRPLEVEQEMVKKLGSETAEKRQAGKQAYGSARKEDVQPYIDLQDTAWAKKLGSEAGEWAKKLWGSKPQSEPELPGGWSDMGWVDSGGSLHLNRYNFDEHTFESPEASWDYIESAFLPNLETLLQESPDSPEDPNNRKPGLNESYLRTSPRIEELAQMMQHYGLGYGDIDENEYSSPDEYLSEQLDSIALANGLNLTDYDDYAKAFDILDQQAVSVNIEDIIDRLLNRNSRK